MMLDIVLHIIYLPLPCQNLYESFYWYAIPKLNELLTFVRILLFGGHKEQVKVGTKSKNKNRFIQMKGHTGVF